MLTFCVGCICGYEGVLYYSNSNYMIDKDDDSVGQNNIQYQAR